MTDMLNEIITEHSSPLEPIPTEVEPLQRSLPGMKAVLFDIYGTLLISGSGDVGAHAETAPAEALNSALKFVGLSPLPDAERGVRMLHDTIGQHQEAHRLENVQHPEIEILSVWGDVLNQFRTEGWIETELSDLVRQQLAVDYECRVNPVWPMPGLRECVERIRTAKLELGIISNAQFFTPLLFPVLCDQSLEELGFRPALQIYSYRYLRAKPGEFLYRQAVDTLDAMGISASDVLYVGNDLLKDVWPAAAVGFKTALFAGDKRSLRLREEDDRVKEVRPDLVVTDLRQLLPALGIG